MAILDYSAGLRNAPNVATNAMNSAGQMQGLMQNSMVMEQQRNQMEQQQQQQLAQQKAQEQAPIIAQQAVDVMLGDDYSAQAAFMLKHPDIRGQFVDAMQFKDKGVAGEKSADMANRIEFNKDILSSSADPRAKIRQRIIEKKAIGVNTDNLEASLALGTDEEIRSEIRKELNFLDPEAMEKYNDLNKTEDGSADLSADMNSFNELIKDMTPEQQKLARQVKAGVKARPVSNAEITAIKDGSITSYSDYKTKQKQAEKFAEATGANRAKLIDKGFSAINKFNTSIGNIDKAINAIEKGAGTGVVEKMFPSIQAASVELDNIRNEMALDVVGATTFGALSAGELELAKDVALPTGLDGPQLLEYLSRKKAAQSKLRDYYMEQIQFLDQGGTVAGFLRSKEREQSQQTTQKPAQPQQAPQTVNWSDM